MKKWIAGLLTIILSAAVFAGCSSNSGGYDNIAMQAASSTAAASYAPEAAMPAPDAVRDRMADEKGAAGFAGEMLTEEAEPDVAEDAVAEPPTTGGVAGPSVEQIVDSRKIIRTIDLQMQTLIFDKAVNDIPTIAESFDGYVQDSYVQGRDMYDKMGTRYASFVVRIPTERLDAFVNSFGGDEFHITSKNQNSQDITDSYFDSKARLDALKVQEERLLTMLEGATELEYMLQVETALMNVRYEIESLTASLKRMDSQVSLSTCNISLYEVTKLEPVENVPVTFGERISRAFTEAWVDFGDFTQDFAVGVVYALPALIIIAIIIVIIILLIRRSNRRFMKRRAERQQMQTQVQMPVQAPPAEQPPVQPQEDEKK